MEVDHIFAAMEGMDSGGITSTFYVPGVISVVMGRLGGPYLRDPSKAK